VILVDANLLIYAINQDSPRHDTARAWVEETFSGPEPVGLPWVVILAFLRLVTREAVVRQPLSPERAYRFVDEWLALPTVRAVGPGPEHWAILRSLLGPLGTAGNLTTDAHIAALALENRARLATADHDFRRFGGVEVVNPLG
jgi:toxin-antitoxin system PIN domain toxin